ncbi:hypothetical protein Tco_1019172 [Tanacetum coccineum]|uniref:Protein TIC 214 n=1 Tax=Tanacetum coccineum TaxID=301880 RepID=A0ABQ5FYA1_9ASTR
MKKYDYGYLEEIEVRRDDNTLHKFKEGDFPNLNLRDIEDMLLLLVQKKISNLERDVIFNLNVALRIFTRSIVILKRVEDLQLGVESYQKKLNITKPETFRSGISKLTPYTAYKNPQGIIYQDKLKRNSLEMEYLPKRTWSELDRKRSRIMIKAIDQQLFERRLMRNFQNRRDLPRDIPLDSVGVLSIHNDDGNPARANIKQALGRFNTSAGNPVKEILLKLNLPDHRSKDSLKDGHEGILKGWGQS